jgi:acetyltransferase
MEAVLASGNSNAILVMHCPTSLASSTDAAQAIIDAATRHRAAGHVATILTSWLGEAAVSEARRKFHEAGIPTYESPTDAIKGFGYLWQYTRAQDSLMQTPPRDTELSAMQPEAAISILRGAAKAGRSLLTEPEAKGIIAAFGITTVPTRVVTSLEQVGAAASVLLKHATSVVVKILSDQISHKSDVGGVRLGLRSPQDAQRAAEEMRARLAELRPDARLQGFTIQPMIVRPKGQELLLGVFEDQLFGPTILFGAGGTATEIIQDAAAALPPLDFKLARDLMEQTRIFALLKRYRDRPPVQLDAIAEVLVRLSLLADESGVIALDARIRIEPSEADQSGPNPRLAIRPYPNQWEKSVKTVGGRDVIIRPIKPIDEQIGCHLKTFASASWPHRRNSRTDSLLVSRRSTTPAPWLLLR